MVSAALQKGFRFLLFPRYNTLQKYRNGIVLLIPKQGCLGNGFGKRKGGRGLYLTSQSGSILFFSNKDSSQAHPLPVSQMPQCTFLFIFGFERKGKECPVHMSTTAVRDNAKKTLQKKRRNSRIKIRKRRGDIAPPPPKDTPPTPSPKNDLFLTSSKTARKNPPTKGNWDSCAFPLFSDPFRREIKVLPTAF